MSSLPHSSMSSSTSQFKSTKASTVTPIEPSLKMTSLSTAGLITLPLILSSRKDHTPNSTTTLDSMRLSTTTDILPSLTNSKSTDSSNITTDKSILTTSQQEFSSNSVNSSPRSINTIDYTLTTLTEILSTLTTTNTTTEASLNITVNDKTCSSDEMNCTSYLVVTIVSTITALLVTAINVAYFLFHRRRTRQTSEENLQDVKVYDFPEYIIITKKCIGHKKFDPEILRNVEIMCDPFDAVITVERIQSPDYSHKLYFRAYED
ncbi:hypothetical protein ACF0H5_021084 [Mactra antiquata]